MTCQMWSWALWSLFHNMFIYISFYWLYSHMQLQPSLQIIAEVLTSRTASQFGKQHPQLLTRKPSSDLTIIKPEQKSLDSPCPSFTTSPAPLTMNICLNCYKYIVVNLAVCYFLFFLRVLVQQL